MTNPKPSRTRWRVVLAVVVVFAAVGWTLWQAAVFDVVSAFLSEDAGRFVADVESVEL